MTEEDKYAYLDGTTLFRFPFARTSIQWGFSLGALLACHKYSRIRKWGESAFFGAAGGFFTGMGIYAYHFYQFTKTQNVIRQQTYARQEANQREEFVKAYFREKFHLEDLDDEQLAAAITYMDNVWNRLEAELTELDGESESENTNPETQNEKLD